MSTTHFDKAATAAHAYIARHIGAQAAQDFSLKPFETAGLSQMQQDWRKASAGTPESLRRYLCYAPTIEARMESEIRYGAEAGGNAPQLALWVGRQLCAVALAGEPDEAMMAIMYVHARPGEHALKGHVLGCMHAAASAFARSFGTGGLLYDGPFSAGSVKQVERGAIAVSTNQRNSMWDGRSLYAPSDIVTLPAAEVHVPERATPPLHIKSQYKDAYKQLFGRAHPHA